MKWKPILPCPEHISICMLCLSITLVTGQGQHDVVSFKAGEMVISNEDCQATLTLGSVHVFTACVAVSYYTHISLSVNDERVYPSPMPCVGREIQLTSVSTAFSVEVSNASSIESPSESLLKCTVQTVEEDSFKKPTLHKFEWALPLIVTGLIISVPIATGVFLYLHDRLNTTMAPARGSIDSRSRSSYYRRTF